MSSSYAARALNPEYSGAPQDTYAAAASPDMYWLIGPKTQAERYVMRNLES